MKLTIPNRKKQHNRLTQEQALEEDHTPRVIQFLTMVPMEFSRGRENNPERLLNK